VTDARAARTSVRVAINPTAAPPTQVWNARTSVRVAFDNVTVYASGSATITFTASAIPDTPAGATSIHFTASATGAVTIFGAANATIAFRAFAQRFEAFRDWGRWTASDTSGVIDTGSLTPTPGAQLVVLYALRIENTQTVLILDPGWGHSATAPITNITDTFAGTGAWQGWTAGNFTPFGFTPQHSWLLVTAHATVGSAPGSGRITIRPTAVDIPGLVKAAFVNVIEVVNGTIVEPGGGNYQAQPTSEFLTATIPSSIDVSAMLFGIVMADVAPAQPTITQPDRWRPLHHDVVAPGMEVASAMFSHGPYEAEAGAMAHDWSALPVGAAVYYHASATVRVHSATSAPPVPAPFAEFLVEFQDEDGAWVDITCDTRTADINHSRTDIVGSFDAATLTLTMANFEGIYSPWPPYSIWARAGRYRTDVPIRVNMLMDVLIDPGAIMRVARPLFTGTTDAINDSWPGTVDSMVTVTASDGFKQLARYDATAVKDAKGNDIEVGFGESTGQRIARWIGAAQYAGATAIDTGVAHMAATNMDGNALSAVQAVAFAEGLGVIYCRADGTLTFRQRDAVTYDSRQTVAQATFTDRDNDPAGACYSDIVPVVDETPVYNVARMGSKGDTFGQESRDADSVAWFGPRTYPPQTDLGLHEWFEDAAVSTLIVYTHAHDEKRVEQVVIHPGFDQTVWNVAARLQLLDRVRVVRHFPGGYVLDEQLLIQGVHHRLVGTGERVPGSWDVTYDTVRAFPLDSGVSFCHWDRGHWDHCAWGL